MTRKELVTVSLCSTVAIIAISLTALHVTADVTQRNKDREIYPVQWAKDYEENAEDFERLEAFRNTDWESFSATPDQIVTISADSIGTGFTTVSECPDVLHRDAEDIRKALMQEDEAWDYVTNGRIKSYPTQPYSFWEQQLRQLKSEDTVTITVDVWYWANPKDDTDFTKVAKQKTFAVNARFATTFEHIFADIFEHESQPVFNLADTGMGTWVLRSKTSGGGLSAHCLGICIDINPSTGSFLVNGKWYGNGYGQQVMTAEMWEQIPECHNKYHVLYDGCPIVEIFKAYGFYWGGDWDGTKDAMHIAFVGDGTRGRARGVANYLERAD